ncbi:MAG: FecCD family ABC transporter permease [Alphaproteobacteria bacterium]
MIKHFSLFAITITLLIIANMALGPAGLTRNFLILELRFPRMLMAIIAGASLSCSGAAIQSLLRNPLAEPGLLGVSSWAAFGAIGFFYFLGGFSTQFLMPLGGLLGAGFSLIMLFALAHKSRSILTVILAGLVSTSLAGALTSLALNLAPNPWVLGEMVEWLFGTLRRADINQILLALPFTLLGLGLLFSCRSSLDVLSLGEPVAASLGVNIKWLYIRLALGIALNVGVITAFCGSIGFIGLMIPHMVRPLAKNKPSMVMIYSIPAGITMMLAADMLVRLLPTRSELYIGVVMAFIGFPFFLYLLLKQKKRGWL